MTSFPGGQRRIHDVMADLLQQIHAQAPRPSIRLRADQFGPMREYFVDVMPDPPEPQGPIRVQAHVGSAWAALANRLNGAQVIIGEVL